MPIAWVNLNLGAIYRGHFTRIVGDPRRPVADYLSLQLTAIAEVPSLPLSIRLGGRNLLHQTVSAPSSSTDFTANLPGRAVELWADATLKW